MTIGKKLRIDFSTFFRKSPPKVNEEFLVCLINGRMGSGKTYVSVYLTARYLKNKKIKTNIHTLKIPDREIVYFNNISDIIKDTEENCIYIIDELSKKYTKESKQDKDFYCWLQHSRKSKRYVLLITQEYLQVPQWLRGVSNVVYTTTKMKFLPFFKTYKGYPYLTEDKEWDIQPLQTYIYKRNKYYTDMYDTFESVNVL